uniref:Uncharacterized protein n=1 Tax=Candidatus Kentrum sp. LPFa TaxID=2126335 RepID=A0A450WZH3_9GAMM|nr:MAG: hypothetical protein BECKLPF1236A_GA0070988_103463 [Candidatus Kentron sp. LPFa]VFK35508.1 MAG: hypothetical protein BECKLPF1236C_GA0070990_103832 [Candidatus Kentron sp. LPFa]
MFGASAHRRILAHYDALRERRNQLRHLGRTEMEGIDPIAITERKCSEGVAKGSPFRATE